MSLLGHASIASYLLHEVHGRLFCCTTTHATGYHATWTLYVQATFTTTFIKTSS